MDDLPHFLLLLLILQRFDDAKWGYFTECPQSGMEVGPREKLHAVSFVTDGETGQRTTIAFGTTLIGRGTSVIGGREGPRPESTELGDTSKLRRGNDLVVKIYWPEEKRTSEVEILKKAKEYGRRINFIDKHIPEMICHQDPNFLCSSTKTPSVPGSPHRRLSSSARHSFPAVTVNQGVEREGYAHRVLAMLFL